MDAPLSNAVREALDQMRSTQPAATDPPTAGDLKPSRDRIDAIDRAVLLLLNERLAYAHEIGQLKERSGDPVYAPDREANIVENVRRANGGPLPDDIVQRLFERIIEETRLLELQHFEAAPSEMDDDDN